jgi:hypothetical protein
MGGDPQRFECAVFLSLYRLQRLLLCAHALIQSKKYGYLIISHPNYLIHTHEISLWIEYGYYELGWISPKYGYGYREGYGLPLYWQRWFLLFSPFMDIGGRRHLL